MANKTSAVGRGGGNGVASSSLAAAAPSTSGAPRALWVVTHAAVMGCAFWFGAEYGTKLTAADSAYLSSSSSVLCHDDQHHNLAKGFVPSGSGPNRESFLKRREPQHVQHVQEERRNAEASNEETGQTTHGGGDDGGDASTPTRPWVLPEEVQDFVAGIARVNRQSFLTTFDDGLPAEDDTPGNQEVLVFYDSKGSLPDSFQNNMQPFESATEAMQNCRYMRVMSVNPERDDPVCLAIQGNNAEPHYFVHKWLQDPIDGTFHQVSRYQTTLDKSDKDAVKKQSIMSEPPKPIIVNAANRILQQYLTHFNEVSESLKPVLAKVATDNTIVAVLCNKGHLDLLRNFVCAAKRNNALPGNLVVFAMDEDTHKAATTELELTSFFHPNLFASIQPALASLGADGAAEYGSAEYAHVMLAKLFVPHLITDASYHLVYHDVDVIPYQDYYAHMVRRVAPRYPGFELYMSYDFTTDDKYAPWGANSGFWFARNTDKTRYFFSLLVRRAALVLKTKSHQATMSVVMSDVANHYGLRIKVLDKHGDEFPVGYHFHHDWPYMKKVLQGEFVPYLLHMNWNHHRDAKVKFLEQMGLWYVDPTDKRKCAASPKPICHYRDKPSSIQCPNSPFLESGQSFW